ncbi:MAG TPA: AAC(3) family N-acetyltransferase [Pyrinomonadaceae bacterium]|nr:AAC(3) family N-acetyltransferase [Pyrinomonadaceae bacterium]
MSIREIARKILPESTFARVLRAGKKMQRARVERLPQLSEKDFTEILTGRLGLAANDVVYVHSSVDRLNLGFPFYRILSLLREVIGEGGTVLFPTYPNLRMSSYDYLLRGGTFDVRRTPSYTGLLNEFARRQRGAVRSLHPTKSVCAIGPLAKELTATHQQSPYPYDVCSPYFKLTECAAKIVGLGVSTRNLSFVYCTDDALKEAFPVRVYHDRVFEVDCVNYEGQTERVGTYAHNMRMIEHDVPAYMKKHVSAEACLDLNIKGMNFFRADAARLFDEMLKLAREGITVYSRSVYSKDWKERLLSIETTGQNRLR